MINLLDLVTEAVMGKEKKPLVKYPQKNNLPVSTSSESREELFKEMEREKMFPYDLRIN